MVMISFVKFHDSHRDAFAMLRSILTSAYEDVRIGAWRATRGRDVTVMYAQEARRANAWHCRVKAEPSLRSPILESERG